MGIYKFFDTDLSGFIAFDISGAGYDELLKACFQYCHSVSFRIFSENVILPEKIEADRIPVTRNMLQVYPRYYSKDCPPIEKEVRHYKLSPTVQEMILKRTDSIFKWIDGWGYHNPEDPAFYRADGTVFFSSVIHDGECTLSPNDDEEVDHILSRIYQGCREDGWLQRPDKGDGYGRWQEIIARGTVCVNSHKKLR